MKATPLRTARMALTLAATLAVAAAGPLVPSVAAAVASATLTSSVGNSLDGFANSVATAGDIVVVGAPHHDAGDDINSDEGAVFVYERGPSGWVGGTEIAILTASDAETRDQLGWSVAISGDVIAASAIRANGGAGAVYVFVKPAGGWASMTETAYLRGSTGAFLDLGWSLAMSGDTVFAGAPSYDAGLKSDVGAALVFEKPAAGWGPRSGGDVTETLFLSPSTLPAGAQFGLAVAASGPTVVVGSPGESADAGAAYVYQADLTIGWSTLTLLARLTASDAGDSDGLGTAVAIKGRLVAIGAPCHDDVPNSPCAGILGLHTYGAVYVFHEPFTGWASTTQVAELGAASPHAFESLGLSVAIDDDGIYAGAPGYPTGSSFSGRVYRFVQPAGGWADTTELSVELQQKSRFGKSLAATGHTLAIGDSSGNHGGEVTVEVTDETAPTTAIAVTPEAPDGGNGWYGTAPTLSVSASDAGTGIASIRCVLDPTSAPATFDDLPAGCSFEDPGGTISTDGSHTLYAASIDVAGNASDVVNATVQVDAAPPTTSIAFSPATPDGSNGWHTGTVTAIVSSTDGGSGVDETRCLLDPAVEPATFDDLPAGCAYGGAGAAIAADGTHVLYAASLDLGGNAEAVASQLLRIDGTDPTLTCRAGTFVLGGTDSVIADVSDATSGPDADTVTAAADTSSVGSKIAPLAGGDRAGNEASTNCPYLVGYDVVGPTGLRATYRAGSSIPVRVALADAGGALIPSADAAALAASCGVRASLEGGSWTCATYDRRKDQFLATVRTAKAQVGSRLLVIEVMAGDIVVNHLEAHLTLN